MGRDAGWLTAASALARNGYNTAPHLIYLPEVPFDKEDFLLAVTKGVNRTFGSTDIVAGSIADTFRYGNDHVIALEKHTLYIQ